MSRIAPPRRALAARLAIAFGAFGRWCSTAASGDQIESPLLHRAGEDVSLSELHVRGADINQRKVQIQRHHLTIGRGQPAQPCGDRTVPTPDL